MDVTDEQILYLAQQVGEEKGYRVEMDRDKDVLLIYPRVVEDGAPDKHAEFSLSRARTTAGDCETGLQFRAWMEEQFEWARHLEHTWESSRDFLAVKFGLPSQADGLPEDTEMLWCPLPGASEEFPLRLYVVIDLPSHFVYLTNVLIEDWPVTADEVLAKALENTRTQATPEDFHPLTEKALVLGCFAENCGSIRALAAAETIADWPADGALVSVPARDCALVLPLRDAESFRHFERMLDTTLVAYFESQKSNHYPLWPGLIYTDGESWEPMTTGPGPGGVPLMIPHEKLRAALGNVLGTPLPDDASFCIVPRTLIEGE